MTKVLVADDEARLLGLYAKVLERGGFSVATAQDGIDAISMFAKEKPDMVVLDYDMPGADGIEVATKILTRSPRTKIIMLTADYNVMKQAKVVGIELFLLKPVSMKQLLKSLQSISGETPFAQGDGVIQQLISLNCN